MQVRKRRRPKVATLGLDLTTRVYFWLLRSLSVAMNQAVVGRANAMRHGLVLVAI